MTWGQIAWFVAMGIIAVAIWYFKVHKRRQCLLSGVKLTPRRQRQMSPSDPKRTSASRVGMPTNSAFVIARVVTQAVLT